MREFPSTASQANAPREPDAFDRIRELIKSANDRIHSATAIIHEAANRTCGANAPKDAVSPTPPSDTIYEALSEQERAIGALFSQLARFREQLP